MTYGFPVTFVASGGIPVTEMPNGGSPFEEVVSGGIAATLVANGGLGLTRGSAGTFLPAVATSTSFAGGLIKLVSAYAGSAIRVRRVSDSVEQDIGFSGQNLDTAAALTFQGASTLRMVTIYNQDGSANHVTQSVAATQPQLYLGGSEPEIITTLVEAMNLPSGFAIDRRALSFFQVSRQYKTARMSRYLASAADLLLYAYQTAVTFQVSGPAVISPLPLLAVVPPVGKSVISVVLSPTSTLVYCDERTATAAACTAGSFVDGTVLGPPPSDGSLVAQALVIYPAALSTSDAAAVRAALKTICSTRDTATLHVYCWGDSITEGTGATKGYPWPRLMSDRFGSGTVVHNGGIAGTAIVANDPPASASAVPGTHRKILFLWKGTNNLVQAGGQSAATILGLIEAAADKARTTLGFDQVICGTVLPRSEVAFTDAFETERIALNTSIRGSTHFNVVCDFASHPIMGVAGASLADAARASNIAALYPDKIHPSVVGHGYNTDTAVAAVNAALLL